jgi:glycosyltransferase involved in cell wall biosynthesis
MAKVNVFIPIFNAESFLAETIESVLKQSYQDWELILLDDCSTDNSYSIAFKFSQINSKIKVFKNESNLGMMLNWNKGIELCVSEYFVKLDADDIWHSEMLEKAVFILDNSNDVGLVFSRYINISELGVDIKGTDVPLPIFAANQSFSCVTLVNEGPDKMLSYPILRQGLSVMRRAIFDEIGKYKYLLTPVTQASTDVEFYFRLGAHYKIYVIDEVLYKYRIHEKSISNIDEKNELSALKLFEIKMAIINYYKESDFLSHDLFLKFKQKITFDYNLHLTAVYRKKNDYIKMIKPFFSNFINSPIVWCKFYLGRF